MIGMTMNRDKKQRIHKPVLVDEVISSLKVKIAHSNNQAQRFIDATLGTGGHTIEMLKRGSNVLGIDSDPMMLKVAEERLKKVLLRSTKKSFGGSLTYPSPDQDLVWGQVKLILGNFKDIYDIAEKEGFLQVDGILFDLGVSNLHFTNPNRGFSFNYPKAPLDMRLNPALQAVTAADLLNNLRYDQLIELFSEVLDKFESKKLAEAVDMKRKKMRFETVEDFLSVVRQIRKKPKLHLSTLPLLALRIAVNSELDNLKESLPFSIKLLKKGGSLVIISFHSAEDRIVKRFFRKMESEGVAEVITKKPIVAQPKEILLNPKARSAKLRILKKI